MKDNEHVRLIYGKLDSTDDVAAVLFSATVIDEKLGDILLAFFGKRGNESATRKFPMRNKVNLAYQLFLITEKELEDLKLLVAIRNEVAHKYLDDVFTDQKLAKMIQRFHYTKTDMKKQIEKDFGQKLTPGKLFRHAVKMLFTSLHWRDSGIKTYQVQSKQFVTYAKEKNMYCDPIYM